MAKRKQPGLYPTPQKKAEFALRRYQMLELYKGGATEKQIGETLGVDKSQVHRVKSQLGVRRGDLCAGRQKGGQVCPLPGIETPQGLKGKFRYLLRVAPRTQHLAVEPECREGAGQNDKSVNDGLAALVRPGHSWNQ